LSLIVSFVGNDKLSGAQDPDRPWQERRSGAQGHVRSGRSLKKEMADLDKQIGKATGNVTP
jgi:hypothetical protein